LVGAAEDEAQPVDGHADGAEDGGDDEAVVSGAVVDELEGCLEVVEEAVNIGEEDGDVAAGGEKLGDLEGGGEVAAVRAAGGCSAYNGERLEVRYWSPVLVMGFLRIEAVAGGGEYSAIAYPSRSSDSGLQREPPR
jgi:hypothetical protein